MDNTENNVLIAEFLGMHIFNFKGVAYVDNAGELTANVVDDLEAFCYDWNWIMRAVEKIESFKGNRDVIHWSRNNWTIFDLKLTECKIQTVYNACIEFIKWYNENKTT